MAVWRVLEKATQFVQELERWGPRALPGETPSLAVARRYCRRLAQRHYENFWVLSSLVPREWRQPLADVYAYCRWADDLADEVGPPRKALQLLEWWQAQLESCFAGRPVVHPVFVALGETIRAYAVPYEPLADLLIAFRQDQAVARYATVAELERYCSFSANPVGRLVLHVTGEYSEQRGAWSDQICTGLQWANFCQDVAGDWARGRVYLPREVWERHGILEQDLSTGSPTEAVRHWLRGEVDRAAGYLGAGWPLVDDLPPKVRSIVRLFAEGGMAILEAIRARHYDVWTARPRVGRGTQLRLLVRAWLGRLWADVGQGGMDRG